MDNVNNNQSDIFVSIIVAVYNAGEFLSRCLDSLINQTYKNYEIICVNDASTDNSLIILEEYSRKSDRIKIYNHDKNKNAGGSYNTGLKHSNGDYICIVDHDDWLSSDAIEVLVEATENGKYDIVGPALCQVYGDKITDASPAFLNSCNREEIIKYALKNGFSIIGDLIRRDIHVKNSLYYPERVFYEDLAIGYSLLFLSNHIKGIENHLYFYSHYSTSVTNYTNLTRIIDRINSVELYKNNLVKYGFYEGDYVDLIDCKYLLYSAYTIVLLARIKFREAWPSVKQVCSNIKQHMPNRYIKEFSFRNKFFLKFPYVAYCVSYVVTKFYKRVR